MIPRFLVRRACGPILAAWPLAACASGSGAPPAAATSGSEDDASGSGVPAAATSVGENGARATATAQTASDPVVEAAETITPEDMAERIGVLADDSMRGRDTPSRGLDLAAEYLAGEFRDMGLEPAGDSGTFIQRFPYRATRPVPRARTSADVSPPNVVAMLPGSDAQLKNTYIVLSAHFDHVGVGVPDATGDSIYNGADDNASGTSALLEVAQAFAALPEPPARSVVFLAVSGEEKGLLGSEHFTSEPTVPLDSIIANINMDMIARNAPDTIIGIGQEYSTFADILDEELAEHPDIGLTVIRDPYPQERLFFRSDQLNFVKQDIPALFLFAGLHDDYHKPSDELALVDTDKAARVSRLVFYVTEQIANDAEPPEWTAEGRREVEAILNGAGR